MNGEEIRDCAKRARQLVNAHAVPKYDLAGDPVSLTDLPCLALMQHWSAEYSVNLDWLMLGVGPFYVPFGQNYPAVPGTLVARVRMAMDLRRLGAETAAPCIFRSPRTTRSYLSGDRRLPVSMVPELAVLTRTRCHWLITGCGAMTFELFSG